MFHRGDAIGRSKLVLGILLATLLLATATALARTIASHISIKDKGSYNGFTGNVTSSRHRCVKGRRVNVYYEGHSGVFGTATTNTSGHWSLSKATNSGYFYAVVTKRRVRGITCSRAKSATLTLL